MSDTRPTNTSTMRSPRAKQAHLLLVGAGIAAILFLAALVAPYFVNVDRYRPNIVAFLAAETNRPVVIGELRARLLPTVGFTADGFHLGNPQGFAPGEFISAAQVRGTLAFWPLVLRHELRIKSIDLIRPRLVLLEDARGENNYTFLSTLAATAKSSGTNSPEAKGSPHSGRETRTLLIDQMTLRDAEVIFGGIDESGTVSATVDAQGFAVTLRHLGLRPMVVRDWLVDAKIGGARFTLAGWDGPVTFHSGTATLRGGDLESAFSADFGAAARLSGTFSVADVEHAVVKFDLKSEDVDVDALIAGATSKPAATSKTGASLSSSVPPAAGNVQAGNIPAGNAEPAAPHVLDTTRAGAANHRTPTAGTLPVSPPILPPVSQGAKTPTVASPLGSELLAEGHLAADRIRSGAQLAGPATADLRLYSDRMEIWPVTVRLGDGALQLSARTDRRQAPQRFSINVQARNLNLGQIVVTSPELREKFAGTGELDLQLFGSLDEAWEKSLLGKGQLAVRNGRIAGVNIYDATQSPTEVAVARGDTTFTAITGDLTIAAQRIGSSDLHLESPRGTADLRGTCGFDGSVSYAGQITTPPRPESAPATSAGNRSRLVQNKPAQNKNIVRFLLHGSLENPQLLPSRAKINFTLPAPGAPAGKKSDSFPNLFQK
jgi:AsmA-like C-terminal region/AsmA family